MGQTEILFFIIILKNEDPTLNSLYQFDFTIFSQFFSGQQHVKSTIDSAFLRVSYIVSP